MIIAIISSYLTYCLFIFLLCLFLEISCLLYFESISLKLIISILSPFLFYMLTYVFEFTFLFVYYFLLFDNVKGGEVYSHGE